MLQKEKKTVTILKMASSTLFEGNQRISGFRVAVSRTNMADAQTQHGRQPGRQAGGRAASTYMLRISVSPIGSSSSAAWKELWIVFPAWILLENITWFESRRQRLLFQSINPETGTSCWIRNSVVLLFPVILYQITFNIFLSYRCYIVTAKHEVCSSRMYGEKVSVVSTSLFNKVHVSVE